jgi:hypothetical protein
MFKKAIDIVSGYTFPVIVLRKLLNNKCLSNIGTFIVINDEGWILTADHILDVIKKINDEAMEYKAWIIESEKINSDTSKSKKVKSKELKKLNKPGKESTVDFHIIWAVSLDKNWEIKRFVRFPTADLASGKIEKFDKSVINSYPTFKVAAEDIGPGTSLCKLGSPLAYVDVKWDQKNNRFDLRKETFPMARFPIEGIMTREVHVPVGSQNTTKEMVKYIETSSPGLKGQSGGPTFDVHGNIWAMQSKTSSYDLGFEMKVNKLNNIQERQFIHVGLGTHVQTIIDFFDKNKISYTLSK